MKTKIITIALLIFGITSINSCKKGENDPALSLKSRNARLSGTWKFVGGERQTVDYDSGDLETWTDNTIYNETSYTVTSTFQDGSGSTTFPPQTVSYTLEYTFDKDGNFSMSEVDDGDSDIDKGFWYWGGKSKVQELKKKETIVITITESNDGQIDTYGGTAVTADGSFQLDRLSGKEMTIILDMKNTYSDGDTFSHTATLNFEKQ